MKRIINGKTYNTQTADVVARGNNGYDTGDCWRRAEELYRTRNGAYFIYDSACRILPVNNDGVIVTESYNDSIKTWLEVWNVKHLENRERKLFGIGNA